MQYYNKNKCHGTLLVINTIIFFIVIDLNLSNGIPMLSIDDESYVFVTKTLPIDLNLLPTLGNGQLGFTVFSKNVYVNGIYNGKGGDSHRARIPNFANMQVNLNCDPTINENECEYRLNIKEGFFQHIVRNKYFELKHFIYPHRLFNRAIVNQIHVTRLNNNGENFMNIINNIHNTQQKKKYR